MIPLEDRASEGRANPKGIPEFSWATLRETAMAEVRPWIGSYISVGYFSVAREIRVVNFTTEDRGRQFSMGELPPEERNKEVWASIDRAFARPASRTDDTAEYVATHFIAETFKSQGLDGIAFRSSVAKGLTLLYFNRHCSLGQV